MFRQGFLLPTKRTGMAAFHREAAIPINVKQLFLLEVKKDMFMDKVTVKVVNVGHHPLPEYETFEAAGMDVRAYLPDGSVTLKPLQRALISTGLKIQLPAGYECQIRPRSGLALHDGISIVNTPGTVDADYRGVIGVILINLGDKDFTVNDGDRICQMVIKQYSHVHWEPVKELDETKRGKGAFGHTGEK